MRTNNDIDDALTNAAMKAAPLPPRKKRWKRRLRLFAHTGVSRHTLKAMRGMAKSRQDASGSRGLSQQLWSRKSPAKDRKKNGMILVDPAHGYRTSGIPR
jgi:Arc/MetJ family transcription regulator